MVYRDIPDHLTPAGAHILAERLRQHWAARGHTVAVRVQSFPGSTHHGAVSGVRSDLVRGLPPAAVKDSSEDTL
jgi:hypothetical protein